jgi:hypothetical protein
VVTEAEFQDQVIHLARLYGWRCAHFRPARTEKGWRTPVQADGKGFPDLVLVRGPELIAAELKADKGRVSPEQQAWLDAFTAVGDAIGNLLLEAYGGARLDGLAEPLPAHPRVEAVVWRPRAFEIVHARLRRRPR